MCDLWRECLSQNRGGNLAEIVGREWLLKKPLSRHIASLRYIKLNKCSPKLTRDSSGPIGKNRLGDWLLSGLSSVDIVHGWAELFRPGFDTVLRRF